MTEATVVEAIGDGLFHDVQRGGHSEPQRSPKRLPHGKRTPTRAARRRVRPRGFLFVIGSVR